MHYAVFKNGGKQYKAAVGDKLKLETIPASLGSDVELGEVLMIVKEDSSIIDKDKLATSKVLAEVLEHGRHDKINIIKFKRRKHHMKHAGHRQNYTEVLVKEIKE